jgi:hypothetical protein
MSGQSASQLQRRRIRISVRALMVLVLMCGLGLGWAVRRAAGQRHAVEAIRNAGGLVWYDWQWKNSNPIPRGQPRDPGLLARQIGVDYISNVVAVQLPDQTPDSLLKHVRNFTALEELEIDREFHADQRFALSDAGLMHLERLSRLRALDLSNTEVSDDGLKHLAGMQGLRVLDLSDTDVSDRGLVHLSRLTALRDLNLSHTCVTNSGLAHLKALTKLRTLNLTRTAANDFGALELRRAIPNLKVDHDGLMYTR